MAKGKDRVMIGGVILAAVAMIMAAAPADAQVAQVTLVSFQDQRGLTKEERDRAEMTANERRAFCEKEAKGDKVALHACLARERGNAYREEAQRKR